MSVAPLESRRSRPSSAAARRENGFRPPAPAQVVRNLERMYVSALTGTGAPFGVGAVIGGGANATIATLTVRAARRAFGPPPIAWP